MNSFPRHDAITTGQTRKRSRRDKGFTDTDLLGRWNILFGNENHETLLLNDDNTFVQTFTSTDYSSLIYTEKGTWRIERDPSGCAYVYENRRVTPALAPGRMPPVGVSGEARGELHFAGSVGALELSSPGRAPRRAGMRRVGAIAVLPKVAPSELPEGVTRLPRPRSRPRDCSQSRGGRLPAKGGIRRRGSPWRALQTSTVG